MSFNGSYGNGQWLEGFQVTPEAQAQAQAQIRPSSWPEEGQTVHAQAVIDLTQDETEAENVIDPVLGAMSQVQAVAGHENGAFANFAAAAAAAGDQSGAAIADGQQNGLDILQANLSWIDRDFDLALQNLDRALGSVAPTSGPTQPVLGATGTVHGPAAGAVPPNQFRNAAPYGQQPVLQPTNFGTGVESNIDPALRNIDPALRNIGPALGARQPVLGAAGNVHGTVPGAISGNQSGYTVQYGQQPVVQPTNIGIGDESNIDPALRTTQPVLGAAQTGSGVAAGAVQSQPGNPVLGGNVATSGHNVQAAAGNQSGNPVLDGNGATSGNNGQPPAGNQSGNVGAAGNGAPNQYTVRRKRGKLEGDVTAFLESQRHWSEENLPDILWQWKKADHKNPDYEPEDRIDPLTGEPQRAPGTNGNPGKVLRKFKNIPDTLSTEVEGWLLEAIMRQDDRITFKDLFAYVVENEYKPKDEHALQMRTSRFRMQNRLASWSSRSSKAWWEVLLEKDLTDEQKPHNTTRGIRPYTATELRELKAKYGKKHKGQKRDASVVEDEGEEAFDVEKEHRGGVKRRRIEANEDVAGSSQQQEDDAGNAENERANRNKTEATSSEPGNLEAGENSNRAETQSQQLSNADQARYEETMRYYEEIYQKSLSQPDPESFTDMLRRRESSQRRNLRLEEEENEEQEKEEKEGEEEVEKEDEEEGKEDLSEENESEEDEDEDESEDEDEEEGEEAEERDEEDEEEDEYEEEKDEGDEGEEEQEEVQQVQSLPPSQPLPPAQPVQQVGQHLFVPIGLIDPDLDAWMSQTTVQVNAGYRHQGAWNGGLPSEGLGLNESPLGGFPPDGFEELEQQIQAVRRNGDPFMGAPPLLSP